MKKLTVTAILLASSTALAGERVKLVENREILEDLWTNKITNPHIDEKVSDHPDTLDPGPRCTDISAGKTFSMPLYEQDVLGIPFNVGVGGEIALVADDTHFGAEGSIGPTLEVLGLERRPLDITLSATTNDAGESSVDLVATAFGTTLTTYNIASSATPIEYMDAFGWSVPDVFDVSLGDSYDCSFAFIDSCSVSWRVEGDANAVLGAIVIFDVGANGLEARIAAGAHVDGGITTEATITGSIDDDDPDTNDTVTFSARGSSWIDFLHMIFGGHARLVPHSAYWLADAGGSLFVNDTMGAVAKLDFDVPDETITLFELEPIDYTDEWNYSCTFDKQFK